MTLTAPRRSFVVARQDFRYEREDDRQSRSAADHYVPTSFEDMFERYYDYVVRLVSQSGIDFQNAEDVAMTILTKFFEKDALSDFDPEFTTQYGGVVRKAVFRTFLSGFVKTYVRHYKERQRIQKDREGFSADTVMFFYSESGEAATWLDLSGPVYEENYDALHEKDLIQSIRAHLDSVPPRNVQDQCDLRAFFEAVLVQTYEDGRVDTATLAEQFEVSKTSIQNWLKRLRSEVAVVTEGR